MADIEANFSLSSQSLNAGFTLSESNIDALFSVNAQYTAWGNITGTLSNQPDLQNALTTLQTNINSEATTRANNDSSLQTNINTVASELTTHKNDVSNPHSVTKDQVGLGNVDNTSDLVKPISNATRNALNLKQNIISDLETIRTNALYGQRAYSTIGGYGNIVTHNTSEYATANQGNLADTALQPNDNITKLTNNAGYVNTSYHDRTKQNVLTAGANIQIANDTISATNTTYSAGNGLTLSGTVFSANITNNLTSTATDSSLSANMGKELNDQIASKQDTISDLSTIRSNAENGEEALNTIATFGDIVVYSAADFYLSSNPDNYQTGTDVQTAISGKQDTLTAGTDIDITNNEISFTNESNFQTGTQVSTSIANNVGKIEQVAFTGTLENTIITFEPTTAYTLKENYEYEVDLTFPVSGTLDDNYYMRILNGSNYVTFVNALDYDEWSAMTIGDMKQLSRYYTTTGYRWLFRAVYKVTANHKLFLIYPVVSNDKRKQNVLTAGSNITISGSTISATDTTYTAGTGLTLTNTEFSADTTVLATQTDLSGKQATLVSGTNIKTINNNSILGSGNITIQSTPEVDDTTIILNNLGQLQAVKLDGLTSSITQLNYCSNVTSDIQTQINGKADSATTLSGYGITDGADTNLSNVTSTGKVTSTTWGIPDYTAGITMTTASYTAPSNGFITGNIKISNNATSGRSWLVNGNTVGFGGANSRHNLSVLIAKDDIFSFSVTSEITIETLKFYPLKGVS